MVLQLVLFFYFISHTDQLHLMNEFVRKIRIWSEIRSLQFQNLWLHHVTFQFALTNLNILRATSHSYSYLMFSMRTCTHTHTHSIWNFIWHCYSRSSIGTTNLFLFCTADDTWKFWVMEHYDVPTTTQLLKLHIHTGLITTAQCSFQRIIQTEESCLRTPSSGNFTKMGMFSHLCICVAL